MKNQQQPLISIAGLVSLLLITTSTAMARSTPVTVQNTPNQTVSRQMVGITTERKAMSEGIIALNNACNAEFQGSRMCTSVEILDSVVDFETTTAWVRPVLKPVSLFLNAISPPRPVQFDAGSGFFNVNRQTSLNCEGYTRFGGTGIAVVDNGRFTKASCESTLRVACCATVPQQ